MKESTFIDLAAAALIVGVLTISVADLPWSHNPTTPRRTNWYPAALEVERDYGVPAEVTLEVTRKLGCFPSIVTTEDHAHLMFGSKMEWLEAVDTILINQPQ